jgi:GntR family transcriptional regulator/MocR family aminotransferase
MPQPAQPLWSILALDRAGPASLQDQIVAFFREAVLAGKLKPGARLPSSRLLASEHDIARITAVEAYERLVAEGYLVARRGAGLFVAPTVPDDHLRVLPAPTRKERRPKILRNDRPLQMPPRPLEVLPLSVGIPGLDHFPWSDWARITARLHRERPQDALSYGDPQGVPELRRAIAEYLGAARGIACEAEQIVIVSGSQQGIDLTARALAEPGDLVWTEEPGYVAARSALQAARLSLVSVPADNEGVDVAAGIRLAPRARLAVVTPSYQYPLGATLSLRRRRALLEWAQAAEAWILEDDYYGEYRFAGRPLPPLYALDRNERALYLGTFSKMLAPGLRLGYLVVPPALVDRIVDLKAASDRYAPGLTQHVLARFISEGRLAAHLRRMRTLYSSRRRALLDALATHARGVLDAGDPPDAGLHLVARLCVDADDVAISQRALESRIHAAPLSTYYAGPARQRGFVLGFANASEAQMAPAVRKLVAAIHEGMSAHKKPDSRPKNSVMRGLDPRI